MNEEEVWERLGLVFEDVFGEPVALTPSTSAADVYGWDSVRNVELMVAVEYAFEARFTTGELAGFRNVGELVAHLQQFVTR